MKVMTVVGTRPEIIKLSRVIARLNAHVQNVLVHTGQNFNYELSEVFFNELEIKRPDHFLNAAAETPIKTIAQILIKTEELIKAEKPDAALIYGDTNSALSALAFKKLKVPIFHMEAGNRCFDLRVPEETNRRIVDHLADINLPLSENARNYLIREGLPPEQTIKIGSCMKEVFNYYGAKIENSNVIERLQLKKKDYFVVSLHREENVDDEITLKNIVYSLNSIAEKYQKRMLVSTHPRTKKYLDAMGNFKKNLLIDFLTPFGFFDYIKLQMNSFCTISDSGTITEESSLLKFPAVTLRNTHERPEGMDQGTLILTGCETENILNAIDVATSTSPSAIIPDYDVENVSSKVLNTILSYTHYINRYSWRKFI